MKELEQLSQNFCEEFLQVLSEREGQLPRGRLIGLYGDDEGVLREVGNCMKNYFHETGEEVRVVFGNTGYSINVGRFNGNGR